MTKNEKIRLLIGAVINLIIFGLEVFCLCLFIYYLRNNIGYSRFMFFTNISNLTTGLISLAVSIFLIISLVKDKVIYPLALTIFKVIGLTMTTLTFIAVLTVLAPLTSFAYMYGNERFITHLLAPLLALLSFLFFENKSLFKWSYTFFGMIPFIIYSIVYVICVIILKVWPDIYQVNKQGIWYVYLIGAAIMAFGCTQGIYFLKKLVNKKVFKAN